MKFSALNSPNIMYILTANQIARVIMTIYYAHCDWLNLCAHKMTQSLRSDFLPSVKMVQLVDVLLIVHEPDNFLLPVKGTKSNTNFLLV